MQIACIVFPSHPLISETSDVVFAICEKEKKNKKKMQSTNTTDTWAAARARTPQGSPTHRREAAAEQLSEGRSPAPCAKLLCHRRSISRTKSKETMIRQTHMLVCGLLPHTRGRILLCLSLAGGSPVTAPHPPLSYFHLLNQMESAEESARRGARERRDRDRESRAGLCCQTLSEPMRAPDTRSYFVRLPTSCDK